MNSSTVGFGIVGCGMVADFHAQAIAQLEGARLVGVADVVPNRVRQFAEKHKLLVSTTSIEELVSLPDIQVVCITTPSGAHLGPALAAIGAGKHLVVEKPLEITLERVDELLRAAEAKGVQIAAVFQARFGAGAQKVKAALEAGRFGRLVLCSAYVKWHRTPEYYRGSWHGTLALDGGGALMNQGIHAIDLLQWFAGMPAEVFAWTTRRVHTAIESEDTAAATLRFADGALGVIEASTALYPGLSRRIEICGEHGSAVLEDDRITHWEFRKTQPDDARVLAGQENRLGSGASAPDKISYYGHQLQMQDLLEALRANRPVKVPGYEARKAVALIRALYASAERGTPIRL
jgi:UDP-N-acetyl-2-amino-2-deoxyglucuronate dehydrogenase